MKRLIAIAIMATFHLAHSQDSVVMNIDSTKSIEFKHDTLGDRLPYLDSVNNESSNGQNSGDSGLFRLLIPFITFALGFITSTWTRKSSEKKRLISIQKFVFTWIELIEKPVNLQIEKFETFVDDLKKLKNLSGVKLVRMNLHIKQLKSISNPDLVKTFVTSKSGNDKEKSRHLFKLIDKIDFIKNLDNIYIEYYNGFKNSINSLREQWNKGIDDLHDIKHKLIKDGPSDIRTDEFLYKLNTIFEKWYNSNDQDSLLSTHTILLEKLETLAQNHYGKNPKDERFKDVLSIVQSLMVLVEQFKIHKSEYVKLFEEVKSKLRIGLEGLNNAKEDLDKYKFKSLFWID